MRKNLFLIYMVIFSCSIFGQVKDYQVGSPNVSNYRQQGGFYDYGKSNALNIEVHIWGFVRYPGKYLIPENSTAMDLISLAGGPTDAANLDDLRIFRATINSVNGISDTTREFIPFNYIDLLWEDELTNSGVNIPTLQAGDNLSVPGEPKIYDKDWIQISLSIVGILISLTTLIITIGK